MSSHPNNSPAPAATGVPILEFRDVSVAFAKGCSIVQAVRFVSLSIHEGESVGLVGESGSGKSTLGRAAAGLVAVSSGDVLIDGQSIIRRNRPARRHISSCLQVIFQDPSGSLHPRLPLWAIVTEPLRIRGETKTAADRKTAARNLFDQVGLPASYIDRFPHELSGGQRQRVAIARALSSRPNVIICDEPTSALDVSVQAQVINLLQDLQEDFGLAYLFISHDLAVVDHMCRRIAVMRSGAIVEQGSREDIIDAPNHPYTRSLIEASRPPEARLDASMPDKSRSSQEIRTARS